MAGECGQELLGIALEFFPSEDKRWVNDRVLERARYSSLSERDMVLVHE